MSKSQPQKVWLAQLQKHISPVSLPDVLAEQFHISPSAAYRRMNGETPLTFEEISYLLENYNLSLESTLRPNTIRYTVPALAAQPENPSAYLDLIERDLKVLAAEPNCLIQYMANEFPFFYYLLAPEIAYFKLYMWSFTVWEVAGASESLFDIDAYRNNAALNNQIQRLVVLYSGIASEEIWNLNMMDTTLNQIQFCRDSNRFKNPTDADFLLDILRGLLDKLKDIVSHSRKKHAYPAAKPTAFNHVWYNEIFHNNIFIIANLEEARMLYSAFDVPNFIKTTDVTMTQYGGIFFNRAKKLSTQLNNSSNARQATKFFDRLKLRLDYFQES